MAEMQGNLFQRPVYSRFRCFRNFQRLNVEETGCLLLPRWRPVEVVDVLVQSARPQKPVDCGQRVRQVDYTVINSELDDTMSRYNAAEGQVESGSEDGCALLCPWANARDSALLLGLNFRRGKLPWVCDKYNSMIPAFCLEILYR